MIIYASTTWLSYAQYGTSLYYFKSQLYHLSWGIVVFLLSVKSNPAIYCRYARCFLVLNLIVLGLIHIPGFGISAGGASRWFGSAFLRFQPGEMLKISLICYLSMQLMEHRESMNSFRQGLLEPIVFLMISAGLLLIEPDFGTMVILFLITFFMLYASHIRMRYLIMLASVAIFIFLHSIATSSYRMARLLTSLDPWEYRYSSGYQIIQSIILLGSSGLFGQRGEYIFFDLNFLPAAHTDFVFAVLSEYFGIFGIVSVLILYMIILGAGFCIASKSVDYLSFYLLVGINLLLGIQIFFNICVVSGSLPTKGLTLPLLSYGGSSFIVTCWAIGVMYRIGTRLIKS
ncbi:MAG: FtsW/RodA/SpoVE family cell cycle protein [Deltaproteobacteria bacterium]|nr:MAG: FtsW/RodA/SpoVE family cell cycle protein [Deltaproteobacteria bacterium]